MAIAPSRSLPNIVDVLKPSGSRPTIYSQLRLLSQISGDLTNHFYFINEIRVTVLYTIVCLGNWDKGK